jgi:glycosyltransferase involved in cell wall biosynthesis
MGAVLMRVCAISFKECWRGEDGRWMSDGGFPLQMQAIGSLFQEMTLVLVEQPGKVGGLPLPEGMRVALLRPPEGADFRRKLFILANLGHYLKVIAGEVGKADVVHVPLPGDIPLLGMMVALARRKRLIARYGGSWRTTSRTTLMNRVTRALMSATAGGRNVMLATGANDGEASPGVHWLYASALTSDELRRVQPCFERGVQRPPRVIFAGRLSEEKGLMNLVRAISLLKQQGAATLPIIELAGDGPQRQQLEMRANAGGCGAQFVFLGQLNRHDLSAAMTRADFCVHPSSTEGLSKAWLDAMAHGLPVLCTDAGAAREVIGGDGVRGWIVPPDDPQRLALELRRVCELDIAWAQLRRRCREYAEQHTLETWARRIGTICSAQWKVSIVPVTAP